MTAVPALATRAQPAPLKPLLHAPLFAALGGLFSTAIYIFGDTTEEGSVLA